MTITFDTIVLFVLLLFSLLGIIRGFIRELLSVFSWILCIVVAYMHYGGLATHVQGYLPGDFLPFIVAFVIIFATGLLIMSIITNWVSKIVKESPLGGLDRLLGCLFGLTKGIIMIVFVAFILDFTGFQGDWWIKSKTKTGYHLLESYKKTIYEQLI
tara:strand:- start:119 stop:589 length:471 start_codon:yes stop_codon:yes gene_type:complete